MPNESIQKKLSMVRSPRVQITYDVQVGTAIKQKELPFVMGVLGDFSGSAPKASARLADRQFVEITPATFNQVLASMTPQVDITVKNTLSGSGDLPLSLKFTKLTDFDPDQVAGQVGPLKELLAARRNLADLRSSLQGNVDFDDVLLRFVTDNDQLKQLTRELMPENDDQGGDNA